MTTPGLFPNFKGPALLLAACVLTGIGLMGVPCASKKGHSSGGDTETIAVSSAFVPSNAYSDPAVSAAEAATLVLDGLSGPYVFVGGQQWLDYENRTARLSAEVADSTDRTKRFQLELRASGLRLAADLGTDRFRLDLAPEAYAAQGGTIQPEDWTAFTAVTGTLTGLRGLAGTNLTLELDTDAVVQVGEGANNQNGYLGAFAPLLWHRAQGAGIPSGGAASLSLTLQADSVARASAAVSTMPYHGSGNSHAVTLPGISQRLVFVAGGRFTERPDGTARLAGVLQDSTNPARSFHIDLRLAGRVSPEDVSYPPAGSPKLELNTSSYLANGGPVDPSTWTYYEDFSGTLIGLREMRGARLEVTRRGEAFQVGMGASGKNADFGASGWLNTSVVQQPSTGVTLPGSTGGDVNISLDSTGSVACAAPADPETGVARYDGGHAFWLPGLATDFVFEPGAILVERADGSARLEGVIYSESSSDLRFLARVDMADRLDPQAPGHAPAGSPKLELQSAAYAQNGGPVDPAGWHYYATLVGELQGLARMRGARIRIERFGPAFQVGFGASGKNQRYGASGWLDVSVEAQPQQGAHLPAGLNRGDINIDLGEECALCAMSGTRNAEVAQYQGDHAFYLPGISHDWIFESGARFVERADGTAELTGTLMSPSRPGWRLNADVELGGRIDPTDGGYPPSGSPKKELLPEYFAGQGGPVDTRSWRYYETTFGVLEGLDLLAGAVIEIERVGPAFQVGLGAAGKDILYGASGWLDVRLIEQPTTGVTIAGQPGRGDINVHFAEGCTDCAVGAPADSEVSRLSGAAAFYFAGLGSEWFDFEGPGAFEERGNGTSTLTGILHDISGGDQRWALEMQFEDRFDPLRGDALPSGSPKRDLFDARYIDNGGPIDFMQWRYYAATSGELLGLGQHAGARVELTRMGPSMQVGLGASGRNEAMGLSGWLQTSVTAQPTNGPTIQVQSGDFNLDVGVDCDLCAAAAGRDAEATSTSGDHAFYFPGIGTDFVFEGPAPFIERADGTARVSGIIRRTSEPNTRMRVEVEFSGRIDPGMSGHAPDGSPKLELHPQYYQSGGGSIDPSAWRYYETVEGRAFGLGPLEGGELYFSRFGPAFQIGNGASGKNTNFGGAAWLDVQIVQNPIQGQPFSIPQGFHGDMNVDFVTGCE